MCHSDREPGLADASGADDRHQPVLVQRHGKGGDFVLSPDEGRERLRKCRYGLAPGPRGCPGLEHAGGDRGQRAPVGDIQLRSREETWLSTVRTEMNSCSAISAFVACFDTAARTWASRADTVATNAARTVTRRDSASLAGVRRDTRSETPWFADSLATVPGTVGAHRPRQQRGGPPLQPLSRGCGGGPFHQCQRKQHGAWVPPRVVQAVEQHSRRLGAELSSVAPARWSTVAATCPGRACR